MKAKKKPPNPRAVTRLITIVREVARKRGYAVGVHGSLKRDIDLIAVPWTPSAVSQETLARAVKKAVRGIEVMNRTEDGIDCRNPTYRAHGRAAWSFYGVLGTYLDLSIMPPISTLSLHDLPKVLKRHKR